MQKLDRLTKHLQEHEPSLMDAIGKYAVLVPLVEQNGDLYLLYEVRAASLRRQPREVCFPGGKIEIGETPIICAVRETQEELGLPQTAIQVLGQLDFIAHRANFILYPILAQIEPQALEQMRLNPAEVDEVFFVPISYLQSHPPLEYSYTMIPTPPDAFPYDVIGIPKDYRWQRGRETVPVYPMKDRCAIWGLTGHITQHLVRLFQQFHDPD